MRIYKSALRHYSERVILEILKNPIFSKKVEMNRILYMGWIEGELVEVLIDTKDGGYDVFHCMKATTKYKRMMK
jgi:hypothetical protein